VRVAILGAGALGSVIGALLARAGRDVALWDVDDAHIAAIRAHGLRFDGPEGRETVAIPALRPEEATATPDLLILLTKTLHTEAALRGVAAHLDAGAHVLTLQNGLGNAARVAALVAPDRVLSGCTMMPGRRLAPGHVATPGQGGAHFRALTAAGQGFAEAVAGLSAPGIALILSDDTDRIVWQKAAFNCAMNAASALAGGPVGLLAATPGAREMLAAVAAEVVAVARAQGIAADLAEVMAQIDHALAHHRAHKASMLQDIEAGRPTEIDSLCAEVSRQGAASGVAVPLNAALATLVRLRSAAAAQT
jgi:2-dehydropantoate 2-reductase